MTTGDQTAIYPPPRKGLPFVVVTFAKGAVVSVTAAATRTEARRLVAESRPKAPPPKAPV
jgi:hypothetical protein